MTLQILLAFPEKAHIEGMSTAVYAKKLRNAIRNVDCEIVFPKTDSEKELMKLVKKADVVVAGGRWGISGEVIDNADRLKLIQSIGAGVGWLPFDSIENKNLCVSNISGVNAVTVAEHVFALLLALCKHIIYQNDLLRHGTWHRVESLELSGKTLGVVGLGSIGIDVAKRAKAFEMRVIAIKRHPFKTNRKASYVDSTGGPDALIETLRQSDFVVLCVPSTPETQDLIGEKEFRSMKKSAYFINVSRGKVVDEDALYTALKERWIAGAGLDVWFNYPPSTQPGKVFNGYPPSRVGIHLLNNVVMTPHTGGLTSPAIERGIKLVAENIERVSKGEEILNEVDTKLRY